MLLVAILTFAIFSGACGAAQTIEQLLVITHVYYASLNAN